MINKSISQNNKKNQLYFNNKIKPGEINADNKLPFTRSSQNINVATSL